MEPQFVTELQGEEATSCSVGASHAAVCASWRCLCLGPQPGRPIRRDGLSKKTRPHDTDLISQHDDIGMRQMGAARTTAAV